MEPKNKDYFSYLLRIYRDGSRTDWLASLENPHTGQKLVFSNLGQLFSFLQEQCLRSIDFPASGETGS